MGIRGLIPFDSNPNIIPSRSSMKHRYILTFVLFHDENSVVPDSLSHMESLILLEILNNFSGVSYDTSNLVYLSVFFNNLCLSTLHLCGMYGIELLALE